MRLWFADKKLQQKRGRMKQSVLVLGNSDSGLYDFRKEVLMALMQEGYEVHVSVPDTGYLEKIKKEIIIFNLLFVSIEGTFAYENIWKKSKNWAVFVMRR